MPTVDLNGVAADRGTYSGWNVIKPGSPWSGQQANLDGSWWPFYDTAANRQAAGDPRLSLEERYGTHTGYVCVATAAANSLVGKGFLLASDAKTLLAQAAASVVLAPPFMPTPGDIATAIGLCAKPGALALTATGRTQ